MSGHLLGKQVELYEDTDARLSLADLRTEPFASSFEPARVASPGFGMTTSAFWVRLRTHNPTESVQRWYLEVAYPPLDEVTLYVPQPNGEFVTHQTGDHLPFDSRELPYRTFIFDLEEAPGARTYYLRIASSGAVNIPLQAWTSTAFLTHIAEQQPVMWIFYGFLLVTAIYNLFIFLSTRERTYLHYVLYVFCFIGFQLSLDGFAFQYLWPTDITWANRALLVFIALSFASALQFNRSFLAVRAWYPRLDGYLRAWIYIHLGLTAVAWVAPYAVSIRLLVVTGVHTILLGLTSATCVTLRGSRSGKFYLLAWSMLLFGVLLYLLRTLGVLPGMFLTDWGLQIGAALEVTLLSLGLADRINVMGHELQALNGRLSKNVDELSVALDQAQAATRAKGDFLASVSHELRTPLNAIINIPEGLLQDFPAQEHVVCDACATAFALEPGEAPDLAQPCPECSTTGRLRLRVGHTYAGDPEVTVRYLGYVHKSSQHLLNVVNSILDFSKLEAGRMQLELAPVRVEQVLRDTVGPLVSLATSKGVHLVLAPLPECVVRADAVKLSQIVVNLVGNAIKFSDGRGQVDVELESLGDHVEIRVRDQGIGIPEEQRERIFESFSQGDSTTTRKFGGTGLGLAITRQFVHMHEGEIWVTGQVGHGSTFHVRLPTGGPVAHDARAHTPHMEACAAPLRGRDSESSGEAFSATAVPSRPPPSVPTQRESA